MAKCQGVFSCARPGVEFHRNEGALVLPPLTRFSLFCHNDAIIITIDSAQGQSLVSRDGVHVQGGPRGPRAGTLAETGAIVVIIYSIVDGCRNALAHPARVAGKRGAATAAPKEERQ